MSSRSTSVAGATTLRNAAAARELGQLLVVAVQLLLVLLVMWTFRIEEAIGLHSIAPLILGGFVVHALLPKRLQLPFFVALGMAAPVFVFGGEHGAVLIVLALGLIGLCHLPIRFGARVALVLLAGGGLALVRAGVVDTPGAIETSVLPILAAMFMFRLAIYLYDLKYEKTPASWWQRLAYFFLLPNVCFPLFPVVDYQAFRRTYYDTEPIAIYQKGVLWMLRGITHILLYRLIYYHLLPASTEVASLGGVVAWMLATYGLYLRISGQFHLIVGILCLFGFNLPETHHLYYLAGSFNDYWRRINIYWKDFMMKLFYYPALMRLRRWGMTTALVGATLFVFFGTWILHSYQWFWLRGSFPLTAPDALFWGILGVLVVVNSLQEAKRGANRRRLKTAAAESTWRDAFARSARIVGMFGFITVLWSLWSSPSLGAWARLVGQAGNAAPAEWLLLALGLAALVAIGAGLVRAHERGWQLTLLGSQPSFARSAVYVGVLALVLLGASRPALQQRADAAGTLVASLQVEGLNAADMERMDRGYYEGLLEAPRYTSALGALQQPRDWKNMRFAGLTRETGDLLEFELLPNVNGVFKGTPFRTNSMGMRDAEYAISKGEGTHRIVLLGASYEMASGVEQDSGFEAIVERRLNSAYAGSATRFEILNFSVGGYSVLHNAIVAERKIAEVDPDVVLFAVHRSERGRLALHLVNLLQVAPHLGDPELDSLVRAAGITPGMNSADAVARIDPYFEQLLRLCFQAIVQQSRKLGAVPILVYVPTTEEGSEGIQPVSALLLQLGDESGFDTLNLGNVFAGRSLAELAVAPWDTHPNEMGHRLLADALYEKLLQHVFFRDLRSSRAPVSDLSSRQ